MSAIFEGAGEPTGSPAAAPTGDAPLTVVCLGNTLMADDGLGAAVAAMLRERGLPPGCALDVRPHADMSLVGVLRSSAGVVVVDALDVGSDAGAVFRFTPDEAGITQMRSHNTHGMGLGYAVCSARMLGIDPPVVVVGVQVGDVRPLPDSLSPEVEASLPDVVELVYEELAHLARTTAEDARGVG